MNVDPILERARERRKRIVVNKASSFEEAEAWDLDFWLARTPEERLEAYMALRDDVEKVQALISCLEIEHAYNSRCATVELIIAASIEQFGAPGWELVEIEFSDPGYARALRMTLDEGVE